MKLPTARCIRALALGLGAVLTWSPARAHFVWLEPSAAGGPVQACFGEYPQRESGELLDKIAAVQVAAVTPAGRSPLTITKGASGFVAAAAPAAPVYAASLDYGVVTRGNTPFRLRYESVCLAGAGQPLPLAKVAELSRVATGLELGVTAEVVRPGAVALRITRAGVPFPAEVTAHRPGAVREAPLTANAAGQATVSVHPGRNYIRLLAQRTGETEPKLTKTYLLLTFDAAPEVEPECSQVLSAAHEARAAWPDTFAGFTADAHVVLDGQQARGQISVGADFAVKYQLDNPAVQGALQPAFESLVSHRTGGNPRYDATWVDGEPHALGRAIALHDEADSVYRIADRQILQVTRKFRDGWFVTNVLANESSPHGFLPQVWTVSYYGADGALTKSATTYASWAWQGDVFLPVSLRRAETTAAGASVLTLTLSGHKLLH